jgi:polyisoprenoid-binding protein YceI
MKRSLVLVALLAGLLSAPLAATAGVEKFVIDAGHSEVGFAVRHFVAKTPGRFNEFSGEIMVDPKDPSTLAVNATIKTASIDTNSENRDGHLKSPDFFNVEKFPEMTFKSKKVTKDGDHWHVTGDLTMLGVTKEVTLDTEILGFQTGPKGSMAGFEARGKINRKDFGMNWNKALDNGGFVLGEDVEVVIRIESKTPPPAGTAQR